MRSSCRERDPAVAWPRCATYSLPSRASSRITRNSSMWKRSSRADLARGGCLLLAARVGTTRLIDNARIVPIATAASSSLFDPSRAATGRRFTVSTTSSAWPLLGALSQILSIFPSGPIKNVLRTIPRYDFPRNCFMRRAPYGSMALNCGSLSSGKFRLYLAANLAWVSTAVALHPITTAFLTCRIPALRHETRTLR